MKRKTDSAHEASGRESNGQRDAKRQALSDETIAARFRDGLLERATLEEYKQKYAHSEPYKHGVISNLINASLLRSVRSEIQQHLHFTEKETDIYKIHQSGDLANLDGLDDASLSRLPSLLQLRDALYSAPFRRYLSEVTGAGELSGRKTDMAINVYTGGCHLLCHDDVIGSRRVSYILYLTDPDVAWKPEWGGALRLFPTTKRVDAQGQEVHVPSADWSLSIPPAFNQLSFFTVQPGQSFHDVEEVYHHEGAKEGRVRMAISGWFHIPQEGEDGYEEGLEEKLAERSSLQQLQGRGDEFDRPQAQVVVYEDGAKQDDPKGKGKQRATDDEEEEKEFTEADLDFLLKYLSPSYLTPDIIEELAENFGAESSLSLERFLSDKFAARVRWYVEEQEKAATILPKSATEIEKTTDWKVSCPPHKHRYLYQQPRQKSTAASATEKSPIQEILEDLLPSQAFRKWLSLSTGLDDLLSYNILARRFRKGEDYTLASGYDGEAPRLEFTIGLTPSSGWEKEEEDEEEEGDREDKEKNGASTSAAAAAEDGKKKDAKPAVEEPSVGGYEIYMAGDDDDEEEEEEEEDNDETLEENGSSRPKSKNPKSDPAIYKASGDEDDGILFSMAAGWNRMSIVLRDRGTLKFVKYVSRLAKGDRWDVTGEIGVRFDEEEDEDEGEEE
ncbi:hypothetical protein AJ80_07869 [Polytolypa hystricis UAMH7299]|uniref:uS12 prolyl 3,4-dihydroxylase n=1 Tax=Polytolypa hystricis (strain UAMH7299) TaxID=1447883 RepID=A0A2B7XHS8_POLH7|nr:hypothetical protein AJ80_07869 [Polytolypa hystricis UAMH7299]